MASFVHRPTLVRAFLWDVAGTTIEELEAFRGPIDKDAPKQQGLLKRMHVTPLHDQPCFACGMPTRLHAVIAWGRIRSLVCPGDVVVCHAHGRIGVMRPRTFLHRYKATDDDGRDLRDRVKAAAAERALRRGGDQR